MRRSLHVERLELRVLLAADFGDAPAPYPTLLPGGARHEAVGPTLGALRDAEPDGQPTAAADGDGADDDGVTFGPLRVGQVGATVTVNVQNAPAGARLDAWIDFNRDGNWSGAGERIAGNLAVVEGDNTVRFDVPATAASGVTFARFRVSTSGNLAPGGYAADGEVEDYAVVIGAPTASTGEYAGFVPAFAGARAVFILGDMDGDGDVDAVTDRRGSPTLLWHENLGGGAFLTHYPSAITFDVVDARAVDFDKDGDIDFVVAHSTKISWYENNGAQSFRRRDIANAFPVGFEVADADGDGDLDVFVGEGLSVRLFVNNGQQTFTPQNIGLANADVWRIRSADVDRDGEMDVAFSAMRIEWLENLGSGYQTHEITPAINANFLFVDFDSDLDVDLFLQTGRSVRWHENLGDGTFSAHPIALLESPPVTTIKQVLHVVDADGDEDLELLVIDGTRVRLFRNDGARTFTSEIVGPPPDVPLTMAFDGGLGVADINGDGRLEILTAISVGGWYEAYPFGDYDRSGRVDEDDRALWEQTIGQPADPPGAGADGDRSGVVDDADFDVWELHLGQRLIPRVRAANATSPANETIDGHDFLAWQRTLGGVAAPGAGNDWDYSGAVGGGDLAVWARQFGAGVVPDLAWINSTPSTPAAEPEPAAALAVNADAAPQFSLAADVILSLSSAASGPERSGFAPARRSAYVDAVAAAHRAWVAPDDPASPPPALVGVAPGPAGDEADSIALEPLDAAFGDLL